MQDFTAFHRTAMMLFRHIGLDAPPPSPEQHAFKLTIDGRYALYLTAIDHDSWSMSADLGEQPHLLQNTETLTTLLHLNTLTQLNHQPVISLNEQQSWVIWSRLPLCGTEDNQVIELFEYLMKSADYLLDMQ